MQLGVSPLASGPLAKGVGQGQSSGFIDLVTSGVGDGAYLVEIEAFRGGEIRLGARPVLGASASGRHALAANTATGAQGSTALVDLRYSDSDWAGDPDDSRRANVWYDGRVIVPLVVDRSIPVTPEESPRISRQIGDIEIANGDGALDSFPDNYAVDGRAIKVLYGPRNGRYSDFQPVANLLGQSWAFGVDRVVLSARDRRYALQKPLQANLYQGDGGGEGTDELAGKPKPLCFGVVRNISPVLIDPVNLIYQVHDGPIDDVTAVYDRGLELTDSTDDAADYAALVALSVSAGEYATSLAAGMIKLGSSPAGLITADARGDSSGGYIETVDAIVLRILRDRAGLADAVINTSSFSGLPGSAGTMGIYIDDQDPRTGEQAIDEIVAGVGGYWGAGRDGRLRAGRMPMPEARTPTYFIRHEDVIELEPEEAILPRWRQRVAYRRNWTVQRGEDIAGAVTDNRRQEIRQESRQVSVSDSDVVVRHPEALAPEPLQSLYDDEASATTLAEDLLALHSPNRRILQVRVRRIGYLLNLGQVVNLTYPRLGLSGGQRFAIVGVVDEADRDETLIRLWG